MASPSLYSLFLNWHLVGVSLYSLLLLAAVHSSTETSLLRFFFFSPLAWGCHSISAASHIHLIPRLQHITLTAPLALCNTFHIDLLLLRFSSRPFKAAL